MRKLKGKISNPTVAKRNRRKLSIRKKINGTGECPRVCLNKSNKNLRVQVVDDSNSKTLFSVETFGKNKVEATSNVEGGKVVGAKVAEKLKENNISTIVFDRSGYVYHGVVASIAGAMRENGIKF